MTNTARLRARITSGFCFFMAPPPGFPHMFSGFQPRRSAPPRQLLGLSDADGLVELEGQHRLRRHFDRASLGQDLRQSAASRAGSGSDCGAFSASGNGADNRAEGRSTAGHFGGSLVGAKPLSAFFLQVARANEVLLPLYGNRLQVQHKVGGAMKASSFGSRADGDLSVRATRNHYIAVGVENIVSDFRRVGLAFDRRGGVDGLFGSHGNLRASGQNVGLGMNFGARRMIVMFVHSVGR